MNYPAPGPHVVAPRGRSTISKIVIAIISIVLVLIVIIGVAVALAVGLGVGLSRRNRNNSPSGAAASSSTTSYYPILAPPTVNCNYGGSETCGCAAISPSFATPRIVQGYSARANSWPWIVLLTIIYNDGATSTCGGTLITYQHVLTAAHCAALNRPGAIRVRAGIQTISDANAGQTRYVATITIHPQYSDQPIVNDIAVLTLQTAFAQTTTVGLCCLNFDTALPRVGESGVIAGWGHTVQNGQLSDTLLQAVIQVHSPSTICTVVSETVQFCAGYSGTDSCQGDSGGPFMISSNNSWVCAGVVSYGSGCGVDGAYSRVSAYQQFINDAINS